METEKEMQYFEHKVENNQATGPFSGTTRVLLVPEWYQHGDLQGFLGDAHVKSHADAFRTICTLADRNLDVNLRPKHFKEQDKTAFYLMLESLNSSRFSQKRIDMTNYLVKEHSVSRIKLDGMPLRSIEDMFNAFNN
jgi:hypothetical protein